MSTFFVHFLKFVLLYFDYISYPSLLLSLISFSQSSSSKASLWPTVSFTERMLLLEAKLIGYIVRHNFSLFIFVFPFFPFSCWMSSTLTNNLIWIFVAFVIMIVSFALGLIFWQLLPEILTKSYQILNDPLNDIWNWSYNNPIS